jgi:hypothetical protein
MITMRRMETTIMVMTRGADSSTRFLAAVMKIEELG